MTHPYKAPKCFMAVDSKRFDFMEMIKALTTAAKFPFLQRREFFKFKYSVFQICQVQCISNLP